MFYYIRRDTRIELETNPSAWRGPADGAVVIGRSRRFVRPDGFPPPTWGSPTYWLWTLELENALRRLCPPLGPEPRRPPGRPRTAPPSKVHQVYMPLEYGQWLEDNFGSVSAGVRELIKAAREP